MTEQVEFLFKSPEDSPGYLLAQLTLLWERKLKKALDPFGLTHTQFVLLTSIVWLSRENTKLTQVEIADFNNFDRMMVSKVLRALQDKKLIKRQEHDVDTRAKIVKITAHGRKLLQSALTAVERSDIEFFSVLGTKTFGFNTGLLKLINANKNIAM